MLTVQELTVVLDSNTKYNQVYFWTNGMNKCRILITGSSGMIGTRLFEKLLSQGYEVIGFDKAGNAWGKELDRRTIKGDLLHEADIKKITKKIDLVVHLAANARVYNSVLDPKIALDNIVMIGNILEFIRENNIQQFIFSGSREIYGNRRINSANEGDVDINLSESPYAATKIGAEALVHAYSRCFSLQYVILRFSNVYGRYDLSDRFMPVVIRKMRRNEDVIIYGREKLLDFTYIDDCIEGIMSCIENFSKVKNNTFNLASGKGAKLIKVAQLIKEYLGSKSNLHIKANRTGEVVHFVANISKAQKLLGYKPKISIREGIKNSIEWYCENL